MKILGIETSCDETSAGIIEAKGGNVFILSNIVASQVNLHKKYGGVYPELAARAHLENIIPCLEAALESANCQLSAIDCLAVTIGPGLIGSLLVGVNTAKTLAYTLKKPIIGINHLEGHIYANFVREIPNYKSKIPIKFPALVLIVSGGHTSLVLMKNHGKYQIIGQTKDDAAGEAFDKVAKLLGLGYPGGPAIEAIASKLKTNREKLKIKLPRPMIDSPNFDFSFSGLKTAVLYLVKQMPSNHLHNVRRLIALEFQQAVVDVLVQKTIRAALKYNVKSVLLCGGVAANSLLRQEFELKIQKLKLKTNFLVPPKNLCTDNAAMIARAGYCKALENKYNKWYNTNADADAKLT